MLPREYRNGNGEFLNGMSQSAFRDALTGVGNKAAYVAETRRLDDEITAGTAEFAVVMADVNNLKLINDKYGHKATAI